MNSSLEPYAEYKDSGVPWLDEIPAHWEVRRCKTIFARIDVRSETGEEELLSVSEEDGVTPRSQKKVTMFKAESYIGHKLCWPGDLVINSLWAWKQGLGFSRHHGLVSTAYGVYRPFQDYSTYWRYFDYLLRSKVYVWELRVRSKGVWLSRLKLTDDDFLDMPIIVPPPDEAYYIARYLDHYDRLTRRYIRAQRRLIELLQEQKQAIIQRAVTRGLDLDVPLKDSSIEWLDQIPAHWDVRKAKQIASLLASNVDKHTVPEEKPVRLCNYKDVYYNDYITDELEFMKVSATRDEIQRFRIRGGDVIITKDSEMWDDIGVPALVRYEARDLLCGYHLAILRPDSTQITGEFLMRCLQSPVIATQLHIAANGITRYGLSQQAIKDMLLPVPPLSEQESITRAIAQSASAAMTAMARTQRQIDLIREYRTRLIADVVTGKLDVRGVLLPDLEPDDGGDDLDDWQQLEMLDDVEEEQATE